jgi:hypothetical protein
MSTGKYLPTFRETVLHASSGSVRHSTPFFLDILDSEYGDITILRNVCNCIQVDETSVSRVEPGYDDIV